MDCMPVACSVNACHAAPFCPGLRSAPCFLCRKCCMVCCTWQGGLSLEGGGGVDRALQLDPPPTKKGSMDGTPKTPQKTDPRTSVVPMAVVFVFKDTRPPVNSSCMYVAPHNGLPLEPHEL